MKRLIIMAMMAAGLTALAEEAAAPPAQSLIVNGNFETDKDGNGVPDGWPAPTTNVFYESDAGNRFLRLKATEPGKHIMVYCMYNVQPGDKAFEFSFRARHDGIKPGPQAWYDGRIMMNFKDDQKKLLKPAPPHPNFRGTNTQWQARSVKFLVPEGAKLLEIMPSLFQAEAGTLDLDDIRLIRIDPSQVPAKK